MLSGVINPPSYQFSELNYPFVILTDLYLYFEIISCYLILNIAYDYYFYHKFSKQIRNKIILKMSNIKFIF
jgi:hypothetical protein